MVMWTCCLKDSCSTTSQGGCGKGLGPTCPADDSIFSPCNENHGPKPPKSFGREPSTKTRAAVEGHVDELIILRSTTQKTPWKNDDLEESGISLTKTRGLTIWHLSRMRPEAKKQRNDMVFNIFRKHQFSGVRVASFSKYHSMSSP